MEYYSPEYFLEPVTARRLHKPLLPSITNLSVHDISIVPIQEAHNPSKCQTCTQVHCSTSSSATCMNQASVVHVTPPLTNFSEQIPTSVSSLHPPTLPGGEIHPPTLPGGEIHSPTLPGGEIHSPTLPGEIHSPTLPGGEIFFFFFFFLSIIFLMPIRATRLT